MSSMPPSDRLDARSVGATRRHNASFRGGAGLDPLTFMYALHFGGETGHAAMAPETDSARKLAKTTGGGRKEEKGSDGCSFVSSLCPPDIVPRARGELAWSPKDFKIRAVLTRSKACWVCRAVHRPSGQSVALKIFQKNSLHVLQIHHMRREIYIHSRMNHPNILPLYGVMEDEDTVCMVMEFAEQGDISRRSYLCSDDGRSADALKLGAANPWPEAEARRAVVAVLSALKYMHGQGIAHRDIKPENVVMTRAGDFKLCDFGLSIDLSKERPVSAVGTRDYMAPEVVRCPPKSYASENKDVDSLHYDVSADIWSIGALAYRLMTGAAPHKDLTRQDRAVAVHEAPVKFSAEDDSSISPSLRAFVSAATQPIFARRPSAAKLLQNEWCCADRSRPRRFVRAGTLPTGSQSLDAGDYQRAAVADGESAAPRRRSVDHDAGLRVRLPNLLANGLRKLTSKPVSSAQNNRRGSDTDGPSGWESIESIGQVRLPPIAIS